ncbi:MAG TPA: hypothetical protein VK348_15095, partial [Planctomycetota bacterium]|nr:hypothetical protein [Planctomycetota bacterium]
ELKAAAQQQAMALWERSYRYYEAAARLSPDDPRILNDTGLMLIYHLNRDLDRAKALFEQAIKVGQPQLDALPKDSDQDTRNFLEEAIGDAWQNLAVLMVRHLHRPFAEYQQYCEKAVTYYPYQQRAAAFMLKNDGVEPEANGQRPRRRGGPRLDADDAALPAEELLQQGQGDAKETFARAKAAAEPKARDGDLDGALQVLDGVASELKQFAPFQALKGDYLLQYANQQRDQGKRSVELLYEDACAALHKAVELDSEPLGPRQLLAQAQYEKGDFDAALRTASALLLHAQSLGGVEAGLGTATHKVRAQAGSHLLAGRQGGGKDQTLLLADVRTSFRHLEQKHQLDIALRQAWAAAEQWAGAPVEAVKVFARGLIDQPDDQALLAALVDTAATMGQSPIAVEALKSRTDAAGIWYRGRAEYGAALELQIAGKNTEAAPAIDKAQQCFKQSMAANREFADSAEQWQALCLGKKGNLALAMNHLEDAEQLLLAAARLRPQLVGQDLGMLETTKSGLVKVADKYFRQQDLASTERIYRAAADAAPEDLDLLNNAGLFARDLGNELQRAGKQPQARAMFEQSYQVYARAAQLDPGNVRLRNDTALILVHHLERDWDRARELLESAIADGDRTLKNAPPDDQQQRQDLDEAVGDCWENLALLHIKHGKDLAAARQACTASLLHYPKAQRDGVRRHLATIERLEQQGK